MTTPITISNLSKHYPPSGSTRSITRAVEDVSITIEKGQLFFILGPSGCGKTTLLRMIAGFIEPTSGSIRFGERDVTRLAPNKRNAGMVFQSYALWPHMTVRQNVAFGLTVRKVPRAKREERVMSALAAVQMEAYADRKPGELSGGQQQRVALARAMVVEPDVLLLDEPLSNLDAKLRLEMRHEIKRICSATGITTVYVTHDQKEALSMADSMAVMRAGRVEQIGPPRDLYDRPASRFVAEFMGETNFIPATVVERSAAQTILDSPVGRLVAASAPTSKPTPGMSPARGESQDEPRPNSGAVTCSIRPEAWVVAASPTTPGAPDSRNMLQGNVLETVYLGGIAHHLVELAPGIRVKVAELNPPRQGHGAQLRIGVNPADVVLLAD